MTEREALKLALDAFGEIAWSNETKWQRDRAKEAITAIKEALAQPEQEPVTWGVDWGRAGQTPCVSIIKRLNDGRIEVVAVEYGPQRPWVGLTDEEVDECYYWKDRLWTTDELVRHVEAKLKEKNT